MLRGGRPETVEGVLELLASRRYVLGDVEQLVLAGREDLADLALRRLASSNHERPVQDEGRRDQLQSARLEGGEGLREVPLAIYAGKAALRLRLLLAAAVALGLSADM